MEDNHYLFLWILQTIPREVDFLYGHFDSASRLFIVIALRGASRPWPRGHPWVGQLAGLYSFV